MPFWRDSSSWFSAQLMHKLRSAQTEHSTRLADTCACTASTSTCTAPAWRAATWFS